MQIIPRSLRPLRARRKWRFDELGDGVVALVGAGSFLSAGFWGLTTRDVLPDVLQATTLYGVTWMGALCFLFLGGAALNIWFFGCIATRCHTLLYKRHFQ